MDPGTALGVVGVIPFALEVCVNFIKYFDSLKSCPKDLADAREFVVQLQNTLKLVKEVQQDTSLNATAKAQIDNCLTACEARTKQLSEAWAKFSPARQTDSPTGKAKSLGHRLLFHAKKDELEHLMQSVLAFVDLLEATLLIIVLHVTRETKLQILQQCSKTESLLLKVDQISGNLDNIGDQVSSIDGKIDTMTSGLSAISQSSKALAADMQFFKVSTLSEKIEKIRNWLGAPDHLASHLEARKKHQRGTDQWFLDHAQFKQWFDTQGPSQHLWLHGKAGCCKTVLCSTIIAHVEQGVAQNKDHQLAYFYFSFSNSQTQSYLSLLCSLVLQLFPNCPTLPELHAAHSSQCRDEETMERLLFSLVARKSRTFVVIGALDECPNNGDLREALLAGLAQCISACPKLSWLVTSRSEKDIREAFNHPSIHQMAIPVSSVRADIAACADIAAYVEWHINNDTQLKRLPSATKNEIQCTFAEKADGMFRWAFCQLDQIRQLRIPRPQYISDALKTLPRGLDAIYDRILLDMPEHGECKTALAWLAFSNRDLTVVELLEACLINPHEEPCVDAQSRSAMRGLLDVLAPLVQVSDCYIRLAHFTVKEFLVSDRIKQTAAAGFALEENRCHSMIAHSCAAYLIHCGPDYLGGQDEVFPLYGYSIDHWASHQRAVESQQVSTQDPPPQLHLRFLQEQPYRPSEYCYSGRRRDSLCIPDRRARWTPLYLTVFLQLPRTVERLCRDRPSDINAEVPDFLSTCLFRACDIPSQEIFDILVKHGANVLAQSSGLTALMVASHIGSIPLVEILLRAGLDVNHSDLSGDTALVHACWSYENWENWFSAKSDHSDRIRDLRQDNRLKVVEMLLEAGSDAEANECMPLRKAISTNDSNLVALLLPRCTRFSPDMVVSAAECGSLETVSMLLSKSVDLHAVFQNGEALEAAVKGGNADVVKLILQSGAQIDAQDGRALIRAFAERRREIVKTLIDHGASTQSPSGAAVMYCCLSCDQDPVSEIKAMLEMGVDPTGVCAC